MALWPQIGVKKTASTMLGGIFCHLAFATNLSLGTSPKYTDQLRDGQDRFQKFSKIFSAILDFLRACRD
jgi:hypothetical protein